MLKAVFPGSFDPPTNGHLNLIERASAIFDETDVVIAANKNKNYLFSSEDRFEMMSELLQGYSNVKVFLWEKLIVDFAAQAGAKILLRGVRALADFGYEFELAMTNRGLDGNIETIFMPTDPKFFVLRSSAIKELAAFGGDISAMVPPNVAAALRRKLAPG
ncbi:MAG TPA: pantetheine-phosphate adenylyltransferase [Spirochaetia bacterium]|nr:pantetheine-phosphate adenylyltransferase [Spirochaetia bacterium]